MRAFEYECGWWGGEGFAHVLKPPHSSEAIGAAGDETSPDQPTVLLLLCDRAEKSATGDLFFHSARPAISPYVLLFFLDPPPFATFSAARSSAAVAFRAAFAAAALAAFAAAALATCSFRLNLRNPLSSSSAS